MAQVDERVAPPGHPDRNLTHLRESLLNHAPLRAEQVYAMPVEALNLEAAASQYAETLRVIAGSPAALAGRFALDSAWRLCLPRATALVRQCHADGQRACVR